MPACLAVGYSNTSGKNDTDHYFKIPAAKKASYALVGYTISVMLKAYR